MVKIMIRDSRLLLVKLRQEMIDTKKDQGGGGGGGRGGLAKVGGGGGGGERERYGI
jgi:hypothetical protein